MSLQNIFKREEAGDNYTRLPNDFGSWQDEILKNLYKRVPEITKHLVRVEFKSKDEEKGYAVGSAVVSQQDGNISATVPVIIKEFKLAPFDVFTVNGAFFPLDEYTFKKHFISNNLFSNVVPRQTYDLAAPHGAGDFYNSIHPPFHSKFGSILEEIKETIEPKDIKNFKQSLLRNAESFAVFDSNEKVAAILKSICSYKPSGIKKNASAERDILCMEKFAFNKFKVLSNDSDNFNPKSEIWDYQMIKQAGLSDEIIDRGSFYKSAQKTIPFVEEDMMKSKLFNPKPVQEMGIYNVKCEKGNTYKGSVIPFVMDFNQKKIDMKLFVSSDNYAYQKNIVGIKEDDPVKLEHGNIEPGVTGSFVYEQDSKVIATIPFTIESVSKDEDSAIIDMWARNEFGGAMKLKMVPNINQIIPDVSSSKGLKTYLIPFNMKFVNLGREISLVTTPEIHKGFEKAAYLGGEILQIIDNSGTYTFKNRHLEKYANINDVNFDMSMLRPFEAKFMLMSLGCNNEAADDMIKMAGEFGSCKVHGLKYPKTPVEFEKGANDKDIKFKELLNHISDMKVDLVKEAAAILYAKDEEEVTTSYLNNKENSLYKIAAKLDTSEVVDSVLSLGFINKNNIQKFVSMKQYLEIAASKLAQLLTASRLGVKNIPETETATAMSNLSYVIEGLDLLEEDV